ncbi:VOC family protein [Hyphomicrobium sp. 1Nfss2.1]|uniref:VOC family protein n=1 Tax=Hyphomicrobium sp. 1Nfss2.1 TaxID=3413936 RepID=UPI003C7AF595
MSVKLARIILYVQDVERLSEFYRQAFGFPLLQHIAGEWAVLKAGACELALHRVGLPYRDAEGRPGEGSNAKIVFAIDTPIAETREKLIAVGVSIGEIKQYPGLTGLLCDGRDPEGNVFQLAQTGEKG